MKIPITALSIIIFSALILLFSCSFLPTPVILEEIVLSKSVLTLGVGEKEFITVTPRPSNASLKDLDWELGEPIASVIGSEQHVAISGAVPGESWVIFQCQGISATLLIEVVPKKSPYILPSQNSLFLDPGEISRLSATVMHKEITPDEYVWSSLNREIVEVVGLGPAVSLVGGSPGEAILECSVPSLGLQTTVAVVVGGYTLSSTYLQVQEGSEQGLKIEGKGRGLYGFRWESDNPEIAHLVGVGSTAYVVGKTPGLVTVRATHDGLDITLECVVRVFGVDPGIYFSPAGYRFVQGESLGVSLMVDGITSKEAARIQWESSSPVVNIIGSGTEVLLEGIEAGECRVYASYAPLGISASAQVVVRKPEYYITISKTQLTLDVAKMTTLQVQTDDKPSNIRWTLENSSVLSLESNKGSATLLGRKPGQSTVVVSLPDGSSARCQVTVRHTPALSLNHPTVDIQPGRVVTLTAVHNQGSYGTVTWAISDSRKGTLNKSVGDSVIYTSTSEGECKVTATLTVGSEQYQASSTITSLHKGVSIAIKVIKEEGVESTWIADDFRLRISGKGKVTIQVVPTPSNIELGEVVWKTNLNGFGILSKVENGKIGVIFKTKNSVGAITKPVELFVPKYNISFSFHLSNDGMFN